MTGHTMHSAFLSLILEPDSSTPLYQQLYRYLRQAILSGHLTANTRLPSTRTLAHNLGISRSTVVIAFEQLLYEGYIRGKTGSGTYVAAILPDELLHPYQPPIKSQDPHRQAPIPPADAPDQHLHLSQRGQLIAHSPVAPAINWQQVNLLQPFRHGIPALNEFPFNIWTRLTIRHWRNASSSHFGYTDPAGFYPLRREIAAYLQAARGVQCSAEQIMIVAGSQQALSLAGHLLLDPGDPVWIEDPCYLGARGALLSSGANLIPVPVDNEGLNVTTGIRLQPAARLAYVTPSHQFPSGATMSLTRRLALLQWGISLRRPPTGLITGTGHNRTRALHWNIQQSSVSWLAPGISCCATDTGQCFPCGARSFRSPFPCH
jgi:GntR family transcriptional regulator/MocR family aminotransferase